MDVLRGLAYVCLLSGLVLCHENCSYPWIIKHLGLTSEKDLFTLSRPVKNPDKALEVKLQFRLEALLDMREADQTCISFTSIDITWSNEYIQWKDVCWSVKRIIVPKELLWQPDLAIYEEVDKDTSSPSPFLEIKNDGTVIQKKDQVIKSMCKMDVYKFPFDVQHCNLSFKSFTYSNKEITLKNIGDGPYTTEKILASIRTQYEWLFEDMGISNNTRWTRNMNQDEIVYMITMRRRSVLYVVNFILPVLFFLTLDYATFLMTDRGGDKLAFKITILLAVTVLQLLLNEILPSSSDSIPLIAIFCIGIFCLMKISLLETIMVMYLRQRDSKCSKVCQEKAQGLKCWSCFKCLQKDFSDDLLSEHTKDKEESGKAVVGGSEVEGLLQEVKLVHALLSEAIGGSREEEVGYWSGRIHLINRVFLVVHTFCTAVFLGIIFYLWMN